MARKHHDKGRLDPFVPLLIDTLDTPAWRSLSHGAQMLYVALKRRYNRKPQQWPHLPVPAPRGEGAAFEP
jgi:hypothetical protein